MTQSALRRRSPELLALEEKYRHLRQEEPAVTVKEPENAGSSVGSFLDLSTGLAEEYMPSEILLTAPLVEPDKY